MSPEYISKYIQIMGDHIKLPLLASLRSSDPFVVFNETSDVTMTEQMVIYASFNYQEIIKEHYLGKITVSKLVGTELSISNIMKALGKYFDEINIPISQTCFSCMYNTNVNLGNHGGLKRYILH